jgi:hypothetical protein
MKIDVKRCRQIQQKGRAKETEGQMKADRRQTLRDRQIHRSTGNTKATCLFTFTVCWVATLVPQLEALFSGPSA